MDYFRSTQIKHTHAIYTGKEHLIFHERSNLNAIQTTNSIKEKKTETKKKRKKERKITRG